MFNILDLPLYLIILLLITGIILYHLIGKWIGKFIKLIKIKQTGLVLMISKIILIVFSLLVMILFQIDIKDLLSIKYLQNGIIIFVIGFIFSILIAYLTYQLIKNSTHVNNYRKMVQETPFFTLLTLLLFVGPAEDLLFIGVLQHVLMSKFDWISIPIYLIIFTLYHYVNVLNGAESKQEFFGMLPIRLIISFILSMSYYLTQTLIYGLITHNIFDTLCFLGIFIAVKNKLKTDIT